METPVFNTGRMLLSLANFDFATAETAGSGCVWPKFPDANMARYCFCLTCPSLASRLIYYPGIPRMSLELAWMVAILWIGRKHRCG